MGFALILSLLGNAALVAAIVYLKRNFKQTLFDKSHSSYVQFDILVEAGNQSFYIPVIFTVEKNTPDGFEVEFFKVNEPEISQNSQIQAAYKTHRTAIIELIRDRWDGKTIKDSDIDDRKPFFFVDRNKKMSQYLDSES